MGKFGTALIILVVMNLLFAASGLITSSQAGQSCLFNWAQNLQDPDGCDFFGKLTLIVSALAAAGIIIGTLAPVKSDLISSTSFVTFMLTTIAPDVGRMFIVMRDGLSVFFTTASAQTLTAALIVSPIGILIYLSFVDWFRSPVS